jgi:hypothetical protein
VCADLHDSRELLLTPADLRVAAVAAQQGGVVSAAQLHAAGLGRGATHARVLAGRLIRLHRGVYAVGHAQLTPRGWRWAAVLACGGPGAAALSHRSAAAVWDLLPSPAKFEEDRRRDATLSAMGFTTLRFTWRQVLYGPGSVLPALGRALAG